MKKDRLYIDIVANFILVAVICVLFFTTMDGSISVFGAQKLQPIYKGNKEYRQVTLMVNVYWGTEYIEEMLDIFDTYGVKTIFFIGGSWAAKEVGLVKEIKNRGHEIGNHGYLHKNHTDLSLQANYDEIALTNKLIKEILDIDCSYFAPPSGALGANMLKVCEQLNMKVIMWSKDTIDWRDKDYNLIFKRATQNVENGDLILMHPTEHTVKALPLILTYYKQNGFAAVNLTANLAPTVN
ncbi:MAG: polysaccharide deacetylase family protein [Christensenellales bacterium]|jgi:peptidoglycan/xylan/chitin deacetylase (PgdA/CDA1 family)